MKIFVFMVFILSTNAFINDYISNVKHYLGIGNQNHDEETEEVFQRKVPYEVSTVDEKFLSEAAKLTGVVLSELDSCQHRVVLKLQAECNKMNDEQSAKMAVQLLNCQSYVEGRAIFPCHDEMSIKDCTINMDSDTWTSYHLMTNRVKAVCYSIRQIQFRGLAEHTVNRLMDAAKDQLKTLNKISDHQHKLKDLAESTHNTISKDYDTLIAQTKNIQKAQFHGQLFIEDNIKRLEVEKHLILQTHNQLVDMTKVVHDKLEDSLKQLEDQTGESRSNHRELIEDLMHIQSKTKEIFKKIDDSSTLLMKQSQEYHHQYQETLKNLQEVNKTVHSLVALVGGTRQALEEKLSWISNILGGTDLALERIYLILWHAAFILAAMLICAFLSASSYTRLIVATLPPTNLAMALYDNEQKHLSFISLTVALLLLMLAHSGIVASLNWRQNFNKRRLALKERDDSIIRSDSPAKSEQSDSSSSKIRNGTLYNQRDSFQASDYSNFSKFKLNSHVDENIDSFDLTPPVSRNSNYSFNRSSYSRSNTPLRLNTSARNPCGAKTRVGTPCKLTAVPGRDFCHRHQTGESVMG